MDDPPLRVLLADDHPAVRDGLSMLLASRGMMVCAEAGSVETALAHLASLEVDLAVVDLSFEGDEGFRLIKALQQRAIAVVIYSMHEDHDHIERGLASGAVCYVSKREDSAILLQAFDAARQGTPFLSPRIAQSMAQREAETPLLSRCSDRELQILHLLSQGQGNSDIAQTLSLSVRTVETYCTRICEKLGLAGMKELRQFTIRAFHSHGIS
jgi:DNA-binding NarL/FixJ family response regulator